MSRYELVIENRVICSNLWEELFANSRIVCHNSSLCLYCLVERSHSSRTHISSHRRILVDDNEIYILVT